jgi:hypothetical protein
MFLSNSTPIEPLGYIPPLKKTKKSRDVYGLRKGGDRKLTVTHSSFGKGLTFHPHKPDAVNSHFGR